MLWPQPQRTAEEGVAKGGLSADSVTAAIGFSCDPILCLNSTATAKVEESVLVSGREVPLNQERGRLHANDRR